MDNLKKSLNDLLNLCNRVNEVTKKIVDYEMQIKKPLIKKENRLLEWIKKAKHYLLNNRINQKQEK